MFKYIPRRKRLRNSYITSGDLTILVKLVDKYGNWITKNKNLSKYRDEYLYANIEEDSFYYTFKTNQTFKEVKEIISKKTKLHPNMMSFGKWDYYDKNENMNYFSEVDYDDNQVLYKSCFDQPYTETKYLYVIIDKKKNDHHQIFNDLYANTNKKIEETNRKYKDLENEKKNLEIKLEEMHKSHEENLGRIKNKLLITEETLKREKREFEFYSNIEKEKNKKIQMKLSQELKDIKDTQKKEKEEEIKREEEAFKEFKIQIEQIKSQFYQDFEKKLIQEIKKLCLLKSKKDLNVDLFSNRLVKQLHQNYDALSKSIFEKAKQNLSSKTEEIYKSKIMLFIEDQFKGCNHINTIAIGRAGVGKTL